MPTLSSRQQKALIFLCFLMYTCLYLGRYSYNANINAIMTDYGVNHAMAGLATTFFFFAYGTGHILHGIFCKHYPMRSIITVVFLVSAAINLTVFMGADFALIKWLWLLNGLVQSVTWSSMVLILGRNLDDKHITLSLVLMGLTTPLGTFAAYGGSSLFTALGNYRLSFLLGACALAVVGVIWCIVYPHVTLSRNAQLDTQRAQADSDPAHTAISRRKVMTLFVGLGLFAVVNNLLKEGLHTWIPSIMKEEYGLGDALSVFVSLALPLLGMLAPTVAVLMNKRIKDFISLSGVFFAIAGVLVGAVMCLLHSPYWLVVLILFSCVSLLMHAIANIITSIAPLRLRATVNPGLFTGIMSGCGYAGSTISSYGLGAVADHFGWNAVFVLFLVLCLALALIAAVMALFGANNNPPA